MMHKGEVATLICGPQYAFGAAGAPPKIPANATVETRLELVDWLDLAVTYNAVPGKVETDDELRARWKEELADGTSPMRTEAGAWGVGGGRGCGWVVFDLGLLGAAAGGGRERQA